MKRNLSITFLICLIIFSLFLGIFALLFQNKLEEIKAQPRERISPGFRVFEDNNVSEWAWSENIGWVSFNCTNRRTCETSNYGVNIGSDGIFSGYAWSEHIGWIKFDPNGPYPENPQYSAKMDLETGQVSGWARALAYNGGWDGWIKLRGLATDGSSYGVSLNLTSREFEGWAWGGGETASSSVIGWLSFNCINQDVCGASDYKVITSFSLPPTASELSAIGQAYCSTPSEGFSWTFSDPDGDTQGAYWLQVDKEGDFASFGNGEFDSGKVVSASPDKSILIAKTPGEGQLAYNTDYFWRLKVWDDGDIPSTGWISGPEFDTEIHIYPVPDFNWIPFPPTEGEVVQFCATQEAASCSEDISKCYDSDNNLISCSGKTFLWTFPENSEFATGSSATSENPQVKFMTTDSVNVSLDITDDVGSCTITKEIGITIPLPKWKEIGP